MATIEKICVSLTPELASLVRQAVEDGDYASNSEVVREALRDWNSKRTLRQQQIEEIRRLWREGLDSGPGRFEGVEALLEEAQRRRAETD